MRFRVEAYHMQWVKSQYLWSNYSDLLISIIAVLKAYFIFNSEPIYLCYFIRLPLVRFCASGFSLRLRKYGRLPTVQISELSSLPDTSGCRAPC